MRTIPFGKPIIGEAEQRAVAEVLASGVLVHGPRAAAFEEQFAAFTGAPHAVAVGSCTAGLHLAYMARGIGSGDEVIVPAQTHWKFVQREWGKLPDLDAPAGLLATGRFTQQIVPMVLQRPSARRILVLSPHPDDETIAAGGTLLHTQAAGATIHLVFLTSGDRPDGSGARTGRVEREAEAARVAEQLGATFECWRLPTHGIPIDDATTARLRALVAAHDPDVILLPFLADDHADHRNTALLFAQAFHGHPIRAEVWAYAVYSTIPTNVIIDITDVSDAKNTLVRLWASEFQHRDWAHYARGRDAVHARWLPGSSARYAEAFFVVPGTEYAALGVQFATAIMK